MFSIISFHLWELILSGEGRACWYRPSNTLWLVAMTCYPNWLCAYGFILVCSNKNWATGREFHACIHMEHMFQKLSMAGSHCCTRRGCLLFDLWAPVNFKCKLPSLTAIFCCLLTVVFLHCQCDVLLWGFSYCTLSFRCTCKLASSCIIWVSPM